MLGRQYEILASQRRELPVLIVGKAQVGTGLLTMSSQDPVKIHHCPFVSVRVLKKLPVPQRVQVP